MPRERGYIWSLISPFFWIPGVFAIVFAGFLAGIVITIGGILNGSVPFIVIGVLVMVAWAILLALGTLVTDEGLERLDRDNEPYPDDMEDRYLWDLDRGHLTPRGREVLLGEPPVRPVPPAPREPDRCPECGGRLFPDRPNCPHCGSTRR